MKTRLRFGEIMTLSPDPYEGRPFGEKEARQLMRQAARQLDEKTRNDDSLEACRELWYRIKDGFMGWICFWCPDSPADILDAAFLLCLEDAAAWLKDKDVTFERFMKRRVDRLIKREERIQKRFVMNDVDPKDYREESLFAGLDSETLKVIFEQEFEKLSNVERTCFTKRHVDGLKIHDVANEVGMSVDGVNKCLKRARLSLEQSLQMRGVTLSVTGVAILLANHAISEAGEGRLERLIDAAPAILNGKPVSDAAITPMAKSLYLATSNSTSFGSFSWWTATKIASVTIPVVGVIVWEVGFHHRPKDAAVAVAAKVEPKTIATDVEPTDISRGNKKVKKPQPGGFPDNPVSGQIHTVNLDTLGITMDFCWSPGDDQIPGVWVQRTEMTQAQWKPVGTLLGNADPSGFKGDDLPVEMIDPMGAMAYCEKFAEVTGISVRLPTSAEWVRAASVGFEPLDEVQGVDTLKKSAWFRRNGGMRTHPVGQKEASQLNLLDMFGNVFEIVAGEQGKYEIRGGSWSYDEGWCNPEAHGLFEGDITKNSGTGFRVVYQPVEDDTTN